MHGQQTRVYRMPLCSTARRAILLVFLTVVASSCGEKALVWGGTWSVERINGFDSTAFIDKLLHDALLRVKLLNDPPGVDTNLLATSFGTSKPRLKLLSDGAGTPWFELSFTVRDGDILATGEGFSVDRAEFDFGVDFVYTGTWYRDIQHFGLVSVDSSVRLHPDIEGSPPAIRAHLEAYLDDLYFFAEVDYSWTPSPDNDRILLTHPTVASVDLVKIE